VGGDYFDVFPLDNNRTAFLIADVSGKGLGAALLTTMLQGALSAMTLGTDPARVFSHVNRFLCDHAEVGRYATMFFGILANDGHLEFINAGHPSPFLIRHGVAQEPFSEGSYPVGLVPEAEYAVARLKLEPGDTIVLFSDGVTEAMDPDEQLFGVPRLRDVLTGQTECPLDQLQNVFSKRWRISPVVPGKPTTLPSSSSAIDLPAPRRGPTPMPRPPRNPYPPSSLFKQESVPRYVLYFLAFPRSSSLTCNACYLESITCEHFLPALK
jgi:hypothetical protein